MTNIFNLPTKEQLDMENVLLTTIASNMDGGGLQIESWSEVQTVVRRGLADKVFHIGDQFVSSYGTNGSIVWDIIGIDHDTPTDKKYTHSLTIQVHDCVCNAIVDNPEALYNVVETSLAVGTYNFTYNGTNYQFTTTQVVPVGGVICFPWAYNTDILTTKIKTYSSSSSTTQIEELSISVGNGGTTLTPINNMDRCRYGSNNYVNSAIRQWLNSNETVFTWSAKTDYDRPPVGTPYTGAGFLNLLDNDLVAVLGAVDKQVAKNTVTDGGGQDLFSDKVFLLSRVEAYAGSEGITAGETPYAYYSVLADNPTNSALTGRIKYLNSSVRIWWLRSPNPGYISNVRNVYPSGNVISDIAYNTVGVAPACCII